MQVTRGRGSQETRREWQLRRGGALAEGMNLETVEALGLGQGISQRTVTQNGVSGAASEAVGCVRGRGLKGRGPEHALEGRALRDPCGRAASRWTSGILRESLGA